MGNLTPAPSNVFKLSSQSSPTPNIIHESELSCMFNNCLKTAQ